MRCTACGLSFVTNPSTDYENVYSEDYYAGRGADKLVDYAFELEHPDLTIRRLEWEGIRKIVSAVKPLDASTRWLDYGCGSGGLVRYLRGAGIDAEGYENSPIVPRLRTLGIPVLDVEDVDARPDTYGVVTAIEVVEHLAEPRETFERIARVLKPGGVAFFTTGNAERFASDLIGWQYFIPEIHIALYEPRSLETALRLAGLQPKYAGWQPGYGDVITFKVLKNLKMNRLNPLHAVLPHTPLPAAVDRKFGVSAFPIGAKSA